ATRNTTRKQTPAYDCGTTSSTTARITRSTSAISGWSVTLGWRRVTTTTASAQGTATAPLSTRSAVRSGTSKTMTDTNALTAIARRSAPNQATGSGDSIGTRVSFTGCI